MSLSELNRSGGLFNKGKDFENAITWCHVVFRGLRLCEVISPPLRPAKICLLSHPLLRQGSGNASA